MAIWNIFILFGVFRFQPQERTSMTPNNNNNRLLTWGALTACLRRAGEILPDKIASAEIHQDNKFSEVMKNKTVHLLAVFLLIYIGVEVTIGGKFTFLIALTKTSDYHEIRVDCNIFDDRSWRWAFIWLRFNWVFRW
jgi:hypothetical protein